MTHQEVLQDKVEELEQLVEELSKKLVTRDNELYDQIAKTVEVQTKYLEVVDLIELHHQWSEVFTNKEIK